MIHSALLAVAMAAFQTNPAPESRTVAEVKLLSGVTGEPVTFEDALRDLAARDAVFLGELHDSTPGHRFQLEVVQAVADLRSDVVVSMEMFERDAQGLLDDYLKGRVDEERFLAGSRPWKNYKEHYRPVIEFARDKGFDAVAANIPRWMAASIGRDEILAPSSDYARATSAPDDLYRERFVGVMGSHMGADGSGKMQRMYRAQCIKDDTMAESMADYRRRHAHRAPLLVHLCGQFHSDFGLGTVSRFLERDPVARVGIVSMVRLDDFADFDFAQHHRRADYLLLVPPEPKPKPKTDDESED